MSMGPVVLVSPMTGKNAPRLALFGLVESAEAFTSDGTAVPCFEMGFVEGQCARAVDLGVFIVFNGIESGLQRGP